jgi:glycosyltransferase involved in cell wall biosynthesis
MRIAVPIAAFHPGTTGDYVISALRELGHQAQYIPLSELSVAVKDPAFNLVFCVDSGAPLNFVQLVESGLSLKRVSMWFIDYRHNKKRVERVPNDFENAKCLHDNGGWIFQSQVEDFEDCKAQGLTRSSWLPLAADPAVWSDRPETEKRYALGFVGAVRDPVRKQVLESLLRDPDILFAMPAQKGLWREMGASLLRQSRAGFNVNSFWGEPCAYDVNMRIFETLSCGIPLITNDIPALPNVFGTDCPFIRVYKDSAELLTVVKAALADDDFLATGQLARAWIVDNATYVHRMKEALEVLDLKTQ